MDLGYRGQKFTWNNGRERDDFIKERLDRVVANEEWCEVFPKVDICVEEELSSDHCPIYVTLTEKLTRRSRTRMFRQEAKWAREEQYTMKIKKAWVEKRMGPDPWRSVGRGVK
jgi:hypothetical protein